MLPALQPLYRFKSLRQNKRLRQRVERVAPIEPDSKYEPGTPEPWRIYEVLEFYFGRLICILAIRASRVVAFKPRIAAARWPANSPASLLKHRENLAPFALLERRLRPIAGVGLGNLDPQHIPRCKNHPAFDDVTQFANVARPRVLLEFADGSRGNPLDFFADPPGELLHERPNEQGDILTALS